MTPPLETGIILPGVSRKSLLELAQCWVRRLKITCKFCVSHFVEDIHRRLNGHRRAAWHHQSCIVSFCKSDMIYDYDYA